MTQIITRNWQFECPDSALLEQNGNNIINLAGYICHHSRSQSRDSVVSLTTTAGKDKIFIKILPATHSSKPVNKKYVRITRFEGSWTLTSVTGGTEVRYQQKTDPAGSLPDWLTNMKVKETPFGSLKGLRKQVKKPQYNK